MQFEALNLLYSAMRKANQTLGAMSWATQTPSAIGVGICDRLIVNLSTDSENVDT